MEREPFAMFEDQSYATGERLTVVSVPLWTARERIAVECFKAFLTGDPAGLDEIGFKSLATLAFRAADALLAAGGEEPKHGG